MFEYNFAYCGDRNYIENYLSPLIYSIEYYNAEHGKLVHHILCNEEFDTSLFNRFNCKFYIDDKPLVNKYVGNECQRHVTEATFLKFSLLKMLPKDIIIMYCDIDQICAGSIIKGFELVRKSDCGLVTTDSIWDYKIELDQKIIDSPKSHALGDYWIHRTSVGNERFNAGCFYMDLSKFTTLYDRAKRFIKKMDMNNCNGDMTVFNSLIKNYVSLPQIYNWCTSYLDDIKDVVPLQYLIYREYEKSNKILMYHYSGSKKPWLSKDNPYAEHWWRFNE